MAKEKLRSTTKRFGPRYGARNRLKAGKIEDESRRNHKCPYCNYVKVKRISKGIWNCEKCKAKFIGRAYTIKKERKVEKTPDIIDVIASETPEEVEGVEEEETLEAETA